MTDSAAPRKSHWLRKTLLTVLLLIVVVLAIVYFSIDSIIRSKVVAAAHDTTGQTTTLDAAKLSIMGGKLTLSKLDIANPKDFSMPQFLQMGSCSVTVNTGSLLSNKVVVPEILIDGTTLTLEQLGPDKGFKNNLNEIINYVQKQRGQAEAKPATATGEAGKSKELEITKLKLTNTKLVVKMLGAKDLALDLGPIELDHPTNPDGRLPKLADVIGKVLLHIASQAVNDQRIPGAFRDSLKNLDKFIQQDVVKNLQKSLGDVGKNLDQGLKDATKNLDLKKLNPFDKKEQK